MGATEKPFLAHFSWEASQKNVFYTWVYLENGFPLLIKNDSKGNPGHNNFFTLSECADTVQFRKAGSLKKCTGFFSSCKIRTRDGWVQSANTTAGLCRSPLVPIKRTVYKLLFINYWIQVFFKVTCIHWCSHLLMLLTYSTFNFCEVTCNSYWISFNSKYKNW